MNDKKMEDGANKAIVKRARNKKRVLLEDSWEVEAAIKLDKSTYRQIAAHTNLPKHRISEIFSEFPKVYEIYRMKRSIMVDAAADNLFEIITDHEHPKNYEASKFILSKYKSDLDNVFERHDTKEQDLGVAPKVNEKVGEIVLKKAE